MSETAFQTFAQWYDGHTAVRHEGEAVWDGGSLLSLHGPSGSMNVPFSDLQYGEERAGEIVYHRKSEPDFRLILPADLPPGNHVLRISLRAADHHALGIEDRVTITVE